MSNRKIINQKATLIFTTVQAINEKIEGNLPEGYLYCEAYNPKASFECREPIYLDNVHSVNVSESKVILITYDNDEWVFSLK